MASVENRVVQMTFDNGSFERKLGTTLSSLEKLQRSLDMKNATKGLSNLNTAGRNFNLSGVGASIDGISKKFLALSTVGITVLSNITNRAVNAGINIAKSLSLDNVIDGFREYELNINSIQTILANTKKDGTVLSDVTSALDELNTYADRTIYNFAQMTQNIGSFTAQGVDLETSVAAIKGISNAAAIAGSSSAQAGNAMYNLAQAIGEGSLRLQNWNSVVNAGMGGEVMQNALFTTAKAMGTLSNVALDTSFEQWQDAGNNFRDSLQEGWITAEVLTTTLQGFSGDFSDAELAAKGFSSEMIAEFRELGELGIESATKVRTMTQLFDTLGEAIASGFSQSFRILLGDFEEATELFTDISGALDGMVSSSADARNELLQGWKDLGGRTVLIQALKTAFIALTEVFAPIKEAFRDIFPKTTSKDLKRLTDSFYRLTIQMRPSPETIEQIKRAFTGFFNILKVGQQIFRGVIDFFQFMGRELFPSGPGLLEYVAQFGDFLTSVREAALEGEGLLRFFDKLKDGFRALVFYIREPKAAFEALRSAFFDFFEEVTNADTIMDKIKATFEVVTDALKDFIDNIPGADLLAGVFDRLEQRFEGLGKVFSVGGDIWDGFKNAMSRVGDVLNSVWETIRDWFKNLGNEMAAASEPGDFDAVLDVVNVGLLGGITALLGKLVTGGFKFDLGNGFFDNAAEALEEVGGVLRAMQADLKANALLKIAGAIGVLALSIGLLALIDSEALTRALVAISVGLGQLVTTFAIFTKLAIGPTTTAKFAALGVGLLLLAGALLVLSVAVKIFSTMNWEEIAKGLTAVTGLLAALSAAVIPLSANSSGMIRAGAGIIGLGLGLLVLAAAMKIFATMNWEEIAKGLTGVAGGLTAMVLAIAVLPEKQLVRAGVSILLISIAMSALAGAVAIFATMDWETMGRGLAGVAGGLLAIAIGMQLMPATLPVTALGLVAVAGALLIISEAMIRMASLSWEELGKGLAGIGGSLLTLAAGLYLMSGAIPGAIALTIAAAGLTVLMEVIKEMAGLSIGQLVKGVLGLVGALSALAIAAFLMAPAIIPMLGLGAALLLLGAGFALFGLGVNAVARGFEVLARVGKAGAEVLVVALEGLGKALPALIKGFAEGLVELGATILRAAPVLIEQLGVVVLQLIETLRQLIPEFTLLMIDVIGSLLTVIQEKSPQLIETGYQLLIDLMTGMRDNIGELTTLAIDITNEFLIALTDGIGGIVSNIVDLFVELLTTVAYEVGNIAPTLMFDVGGALLDGLWDGISAGIGKIATKVGEFIDSVIGWFKSGFGIFSPSRVFAALGGDLMKGLLKGIVEKAVDVTNWFIALPGEVLGWLGDLIQTLVAPGKRLITGFLNGIKDIATGSVKFYMEDLPNKILSWLGSLLSTLRSKGKDLIKGFYNGVLDIINDKVKPYLSGLLGKVVGWVGSGYETLRHVGRNLIIGMWNGIGDKVGWLKDKIGGLAGDVLGWMKGGFGILSPSRKTREIGGYLGEGLGLGILDEEEYVLKQAQEIVDKTLEAFNEMGDIDPVITPVVDLTELEKEARKIGDYVNYDAVITPNTSYEQAQGIASTEYVTSTGDNPVEQGGPTEINFEQVINSPTELSTVDIYRQTNNLITLAKEELEIS